MLAPASKHSVALAAISRGSHGTLGFFFRVAYSFTRASMMRGSMRFT